MRRLESSSPATATVRMTNPAVRRELKATAAKADFNLRTLRLSIGFSMKFSVGLLSIRRRILRDWA